MEKLKFIKQVLTPMQINMNNKKHSLQRQKIDSFNFIISFQIHIFKAQSKTLQTLTTECLLLSILLLPCDSCLSENEMWNIFLRNKKSSQENRTHQNLFRTVFFQTKNLRAVLSTYHCYYKTTPAYNIYITGNKMAHNVYTK